MRSKKSKFFEMFLGKQDDSEIIMDNTCDPEFILWKNLGRTRPFRFVMKIRSLCVMVAIIACTYFGVLYYKDFRSSMFAKVLPVLG